LSQRIYPTEVELNPRGSVYLEHLTLMTLNVELRLDIKMLLLSHRNNYKAKKSKQDKLRINTCENEDGYVVVEASLPHPSN
jgi:hypothetical protein